LPTPRLSDELAKEAADAFIALGEKQAASTLLRIPRTTFCSRLKIAAERGMLGTKPVLPGFRLSKTTTVLDGDGEVVREFVQQKAGEAEPYEMPEGFTLKRDSAYLDGEGRRIGGWKISEPTKEHQLAAMRAVADALKDELPRAEPVVRPAYTNSDLLVQYTITDAHLGALAWNEETGGGDYDLAIGERLIIDWFAAAIEASPPAERAVFAQLGDFLHYDSFKSITPEHGHLLDGDTRYPKMVRAAIRIVRTVIRMLLEKHGRLDIIMSDANHDPSSEVWLREMMAAFYDNEPRVKVDTNPGTYSMLEHGDVTLFFHHGHRRGVSNVDSVFVGKFREAYGRTRFSYAHVGHKHADELKSTNLMKVEQHETLAAPDAYASNGGWLSGRSAKAIIYHSRFGYVGRTVLTPEMVAGASRMQAANDNEPGRMVA
jgi:hypothetical protein